MICYFQHCVICLSHSLFLLVSLKTNKQNNSFQAVPICDFIFNEFDYAIIGIDVIHIHIWYIFTLNGAHRRIKNYDLTRFYTTNNYAHTMHQLHHRTSRRSQKITKRIWKREKILKSTQTIEWIENQLSGRCCCQRCRCRSYFVVLFMSEIGKKT